MAIGPSNPLANPNVPLSGQALITAAQALANAQTQPAITAIAQQIAQNQRQTAGAQNLTGQYFNQLGQQAQQGVQDEQGIQNALNSQLQGLGQQENQALQGIGQNAQQSFQSHIPTGDYGNAGMQALTQEIARQQGLAAQQQGNMQAFGAKQGANYSGLAASQLGTFGLKGQEDLNQLAQAGQIKNAPLNDKIGQLQQTRAADFATALGKLRQQEISNQIADQGLGIKQQAINATVNDNIRTNNTSAANNQRTAATSAANNAATNATSRANNAVNNDPNHIGSAAWYRYQQAHIAQEKAATAAAKQAATTGTGSTKPLVLGQQNTIYRNLNEAAVLVQRARAAGHSDAQIQQALQTGTLQKGLPALDGYLAQAAFELIQSNGAVSATTAAAMHAHGLRGGTYNNQPIKVLPPPNANYNPSTYGGGAGTH